MNPLPPGEHQLQYKIVYQEPSAGPLKKYVPIFLVIGIIWLSISIPNFFKANEELQRASLAVEESKTELEKAIQVAEQGAKECIASEGYENCVIVCADREQELYEQCLDIMNRADAEINGS